MDAEEKLTALKKAYADIILSISKEAAARVMASERKSVRYQHELKVAKEEGVRMLLRLKQMMDSQISEAAAAAMNQQKKIEELEAQLQEAEDIVKDLRDELGEVQAELERMKNEDLQHMNEPDNACSREIPTDDKICSYQSSEYRPPNESDEASDVRVPYMSRRNECRKCYNKIIRTCGSYIGNRDVPSIILRGEELGLYRNGCTQRIRACERNLLDRDFCLSEETDKAKDEKNGKELEDGRGTSKAPVTGAKTLTELEKKLLADIKLDGFQSFLQRRKRASRRKKTVIPKSGEQSYLFLKPDHLPEQSVTTDPILVQDSAHSDENPSKMGPRLSQDKIEPQTQLECEEAIEKERNLMEICGGKTMHKDEGVDEKMANLGEVTGLSESLWSADCKADIDKVDVPSHGLESNSSETTKKLCSQTVRGRVIKYTFQRKRKRQALSGSELNGSPETEKKTGDGQNDDQKLEQPKSSLSTESSRKKQTFSRYELSGSLETEKKTGDGQNDDQKLDQPKSSLSMESSRESRQLAKVARQVGDGQKLEKPRSSLSMESSRDSRRLAQVARQLISLSEKKWWD